MGQEKMWLMLQMRHANLWMSRFQNEKFIKEQESIENTWFGISGTI